MLDVDVIDDPAAAMAALDPVRANILAILAEPGSSTTVAAALGLPRQQVNYHLRTLERHNLVRVVEERPKRGLTERVMLATARAYVVSPSTLGENAADPARTDRLSTRYLIAVAARMVGEVADLARRADEARKPLATLAIDSEIRFASAADRAAFTAELTAAVTALAAKYHDEQANAGVGTESLSLPIQFPVRPRAQRGDLTMDDEDRSIELEIEVVGTPEEVWRAIATGPGISSWYVPHTVEEREGGAAMASFGPGPEMQIPGRVAAWEPPRRVVFDGGEGAGGLAFEWLVEARDGGTCVVRLVNSGFGSGDDWDGQYDGMTDGWRLFLLNLKLHLEHFRGQTATALLPTATWAGPREEAWAALTDQLGIPAAPVVGDRIQTSADDAPTLAGTVVDVASWRLALLVDQPAPGTAILAVEGTGDQVSVSIWSYLYGADGAAAAKRDEPRWAKWLSDRALPIAKDHD